MRTAPSARHSLPLLSRDQAPITLPRSRAPLHVLVHAAAASSPSRRCANAPLPRRRWTSSTCARGYFSCGGGKRGKAPSTAESLLRAASVDWLRSHARLDPVLARDDNRVVAAFRRARLSKDPTVHFLLTVNLQVPGRPDAYSAVFYFEAEAPIPPDLLLGRFIHGDDAHRNARFKIANRIVKW